MYSVLSLLGVYRNNGYLIISCNGGLNQMRAAVGESVNGPFQLIVGYPPDVN